MVDLLNYLLAWLPITPLGHITYYKTDNPFISATIEYPVCYIDANASPISGDAGLQPLLVIYPKLKNKRKVEEINSTIAAYAGQPFCAST